jgi:hypothetical protein
MVDALTRRPAVLVAPANRREEIHVPRVQVWGDDGWLALDERICGEQAGSAYFRDQLADRIGWAVADAEQRREPIASEDGLDTGAGRPISVGASVHRPAGTAYVGAAHRPTALRRRARPPLGGPARSLAADR